MLLPLFPSEATTASGACCKIARSLDRPPTEPELFWETNTRKRDRSVVKKCPDFSANYEQATQHAHEEGDESADTVDPNVVWRQTLSEPYKNRVYGADGCFASFLRRSGYGGSSTSATSTHIGPAALKVVDLREEVQNLTQSLENQGQDTLAKRDARAEKHLRHMEEMQRQMAAFYNPLRLESNTAVGGSDSLTAPLLPPRPPRQQPDHPLADDDDGYEDA
ncbi:hypothetical protein PIB30_088938 [Stylosanthes scabra]|uniref:Uncharacterized protein n=1 Tax=Stylosanthes scabra TaxID=79078 RepID=A0ABU6VTI2_9FABA|nr:hypothetical protein [Stylosanthes scabra]